MMTTIEIEGPFYDLDGGTYFEESEALAEMLAEEGLLLLGGKAGPFYSDAGGDENTPVAIYVNCNDVFEWGSADAEALPMDGIEDFYTAWKSGQWGALKWACYKRGVQPQDPIIRDMKKSGDWDSGMEGLPSATNGGECG